MCDIKVISEITRMVFEFEERIIKDFVKSADISIFDFCIFIVHCIKRETISKIVY